MTRIVAATFNIQDTEPANAILKVKTSGGSTHSDSSSSSSKRRKNGESNSSRSYGRSGSGGAAVTHTCEHQIKLQRIRKRKEKHSIHCRREGKKCVLTSIRYTHNL